MLMAEYNQLMNQRMTKASGHLSSVSLAANKGAFFKSVIGTLNHIMVGDILWLKRFSTHPSAYATLKPLDIIEKPKRLNSVLFSDLATFSEERAKLDSVILEWCSELKESDLDTPLKYVNYKGVANNKRLGDLILHLFLHQIHHRGQITTLLSQENIDFGETDLPEIVPDEE
jgi:uncharacterized damage-inducible protein DinB